MDIDLKRLPNSALLQSEREWLRDQAAALPEDAIIVHLGVEGGASCLCSRAGNETATIIGLDINTDNARIPEWANVELVEADSNLYRYEDEPDFVLVDADHAKGAVLADILTWGPLVKPGGVLAFHDYGNFKLRWCAGVKAAVDSWDWTGWEEVAAPGSIKAYRKVETGKDEEDGE